MPSQPRRAGHSAAQRGARYRPQAASPSRRRSSTRRSGEQYYPVLRRLGYEISAQAQVAAGFYLIPSFSAARYSAHDRADTGGRIGVGHSRTAALSFYRSSDHEVQADERARPARQAGLHPGRPQRPQDESGKISDDTRIRASAPAIERALKAGAAVMVTSHLGRPKEGKFDPKDSLAPVAKRLSEILKREVPSSRTG